MFAIVKQFFRKKGQVSDLFTIPFPILNSSKVIFTVLTENKNDVS